MSDHVYIEIQNEICIICLEKMNLAEDYLTPVCVKCDVIAHVSCLNEWYQKKNKKVCPICLKTEKYYLKYLKNKNIESQTNNISRNINSNNIDGNINDHRNNNMNDNIDDNIDDDIDDDIDDNMDDNMDNNIHNDETELIISNYYRLNNDTINRFKCKIMCLCILFIFVTFYFFSIYHY